MDALVFSGGIGENSVALRTSVGDAVRCLGFAGVDAEKNSNANSQQVADIGVSNGKEDRRMLVCKTDEQVCFLGSVMSMKAD